MLRKKFIQIREYADLHRVLPISTVSEAAFHDSLRSNRLLSRLREAYLTQRFDIQNEDPSEGINSLHSLPMTILPKENIFAQVSKDAKIGHWRKATVKWFRLGLYMLKYYKDGVKNTYILAKRTKPLLQNYNAKNCLISELFKKVEFNEIEHRLMKKSNNDTIKPLPLSRKQFVECHRRKEVWKIPTFFLLALMFEELTAVICYVWPKVAPHNCLTPGGFKKISRAHANEQLDKLNKVPPYASPYMLTRDEVFAKLRSLAIEETPYWKLKLYRFMDNKSIPQEALVKAHQFLFIDDWLLLQHILHEPMTKLTVAELVDCIWLRQLYYKHEDINIMANNTEGRRVLVWRLLIYWAFRFDKTVSCGGDKLFAERWGVNNIALLNYSGKEGGSLVGRDELPILERLQ